MCLYKESRYTGGRLGTAALWAIRMRDWSANGPKQLSTWQPTSGRCKQPLDQSKMDPAPKVASHSTVCPCADGPRNNLQLHLTFAAPSHHLDSWEHVRSRVGAGHWNAWHVCVQSGPFRAALGAFSCDCALCVCVCKREREREKICTCTTVTKFSIRVAISDCKEEREVHSFIPLLLSTTV